MSEYELCHYGVKGMKWGVRKKRTTEADVGAAKAAYKTAKKEYSRSFNKAYSKSVAAYSPVKKHRQANDERWADAVDKAQKMNDAKTEYRQTKSAYKAQNKTSSEVPREKLARAVSKGVEAYNTYKVMSLTDDIFYSGAGKRAANNVIKHIGRAVMSVNARAHGATSVEWFD